MCSLKSLFPKQGSVKGCFRNIKAMGSFIDLKTMNTSGISYGCPDDLLVRALSTHLLEEVLEMHLYKTQI